MIKYIKPIFFISIAYSIIGVIPLAKSTHDACNGGAFAMGMAIFSAICFALTLPVVLNIKQNKRSIKITRNIILSILSLFIWGFWAVTFSMDDLKTGIIYFSPFLIANILIVIIAFGKQEIISSENILQKK